MDESVVQEVVRQYGMQMSARGQIRGFTYRALKTVYAAAQRQQLIDFGYPDRRIDVTSPDAIVRIGQFADEEAARIPRAYNDYLAGVLRKLPDDATVPEIQRAVKAFREAVATYNRETLIPRQERWTRSTARKDLMERNHTADGSRTLAEAVPWRWVQKTDYADPCAEAAAMSPAPLDQLLSATGGRMPGVHFGCQCDCYPERPEPDLLPPLGSLVLG